ncbi:hypothetical protein HNP38_002382 [Chryseobacterium defluvii]|uniref:Uncharacterized protein n=1 Tax=Chryseobacterium defluvii TaxID=160396 RepID=A0A840KGD6_9FLAO|nr:hypothetical protein [Chryseobacterium defluvii]
MSFQLKTTSTFKKQLKKYQYVPKVLKKLKECLDELVT